MHGKVSFKPSSRMIETGMSSGTFRTFFAARCKMPSTWSPLKLGLEAGKTSTAILADRPCHPEYVLANGTLADLLEIKLRLIGAVESEESCALWLRKSVRLIGEHENYSRCRHPAGHA